MFNAVLRPAAVGLCGWVCYQLVKQNGRILLELEEIRSRLEETEPAATPSRTQSLAIGTPAPSFDLPALNGGRMSLQDLRGRQALLVFWDPNCGFCRQMARDLADLPAEGKSGGPIPVLISTAGEKPNRDLVEEHGIACPVLLQKDREVAAAYGATGTPMAYVIDDQGRIASSLAIGAQNVLTLAQSGESASQNGDQTHGEGRSTRSRTIRPVTTSQILRSGLPAGTPAPTFRLPSLEGGEVGLEDFRGRRVLLVFSDPACGPCNLLVPDLERLHRSAPDLQILMVSRGDPEANREKAREHGLTFPVVLQRQWEISRAYGMFATPIAFLIDERGIIAADVASGSDAILALASGAEQVGAARA
jgi:peroxiredoxin